MKERDEALQVLKEHLRVSQDKRKKMVDKKRQDVEFQVGDWVSLKIQPYRQSTLQQWRNEKLSPKTFGPYRVKERVGAVA